MQAEPLKRTPLFSAHKALSARIVPFAGWEMPVQYVGVLEEHRAVRERAGLFDVSHMGELRLRGPDALKVVDRLVTNDVGNLPFGKAVYTVACNAGGTILDDLIIYHLGAEDVLVVCNAGNLEKMSAHFSAHSSGQCSFEDQSAHTALLALQGPKAFEVLRNAKASEPLLQMPRFGVAEGDIGGIAVLAARTGYTGEDGAELFVHNDHAEELWNRVLSAGKELGAAAIGLGARDTLRLEASLRLYGNDIDETTDPWEAGLGWTVKLDKGDFLGRDALLERKQRGLTRKLVGLEMVGRGIARHDYPVVDATGATIGKVTSGSPGPTVGKNVGMAYVPTAHAGLGSPLLIDIRGKAIDARVIAMPFYKRPA
jgi:aminomethyltransferase